MILRVANIFFVLAILSAMSCASSGSASKKSDGRGDYYEDLSAYRPDFTEALDTIESSDEQRPMEREISSNLTPQYDNTGEVNMLLDSITYLKRNINYVDGFTIQVYTGINKDQANEARAQVYNIIPDARPEMNYNQPNFKVKVGKFYTRREALQTFSTLRRAFPAAIIIPERINVSK